MRNLLALLVGLLGAFALVGFVDFIGRTFGL